MKNLSITVGRTVFLCLILCLIISDILYTSSFQPPPSRTGAPGETNCTNCHAGTPGTGPGSVSVIFNSGNNDYSPDSVYAVSVSVDDTTKTRFGFEIVCLDTTNNNAGTFMLTNTNNTSMMSGMGRTYVGHKSADSNTVWYFGWQAPSSVQGVLTFYAAGNAANWNNSSIGDNVYLANHAIYPDSLSGTAETLNHGNWLVYPNPAQKYFSLQPPRNLSGRVLFSLVNIRGWVLKEWDSVSNTIFHIQLPEGIDEGIYFLAIKTGTGTEKIKIILL